MNHDRIHHLHRLSGLHRNFSQVAYESGSDSDERDWRGGHPSAIAFARSNRPQQRLPKLLLNDQKPSAARGFAHVSQAIPREDTSALRGSRPSGPLRQSSAAATSSGPPSPWADGETKKRIIDALKDEHSDIHLLIGDETTTGCAVNYAKIQEVYAPTHDKNRFRQNFQRLIKNKKEMTGPFKVMTSAKKKSTNEIEPWYTSSKRTCLGYTLLHDMYVKQPNMINPMTAEEIWKSQPEFQKYPLQDFKKYNKNMKALVSQKVRRAATEEAIYQEDMRHHPIESKYCIRLSSMKITADVQCESSMLIGHTMYFRLNMSPPGTFFDQFLTLSKLYLPLNSGSLLFSSNIVWMKKELKKWNFWSTKVHIGILRAALEVLYEF